MSFWLDRVRLRKGGFFIAAIAAGLMLSVAVGNAAMPAVPDWWTGPPGEFQKMFDAAQREGEVIFWGSSSVQGKTVHAAWPKDWRIKVNFLEVDHEEQVTRILTESRAGLHTVDVLNPGLLGVHLLQQRGVLAPLVPENMRILRDIPGLLTKVNGVTVGWNPRFGGRVFMYNTDKVKDPPKDWPDLLDPKWKGRMGFDMDMLHILPLACPEGERVGWGLEKVRNFLRQLAKQKPQYHSQGRLMATWVASGKVDVLAGGFVSHVLALRKQGAPIDAVFPKFLGMAENLYAVAAKAPHPNAARLLIYWMMGPESLRSLWDVGFYGHILIPTQYYDDPGYNYYHELAKGKTIVQASIACVARAEKENWVATFRKDIGFD
jgi:iron(III) transport system substrate-binding protein